MCGVGRRCASGCGGRGSRQATASSSASSSNPASGCRPGWEIFRELEATAVQLAQRAPLIRARPARRIADAPDPESRHERAAIDLGATLATEFANPSLAVELASVATVVKPTAAQAKQMLQPYVTAWGLDPVWDSTRPQFPPTVADFPRHAGYAGGLTLDELPASVAVVVAAHDVHFESDRKLWYCDIEVDPGFTYFPFVRLALARYQAHSVAGAHLSRVVMTDFIQLVPDRMAKIVLSETSVQVTVEGYSGRNVLATIPVRPSLDLPVAGGPTTAPNTTMRAVLERRVPGIPGDLGWERVGSESTLQANAWNFFVTWTGTVPLPSNAHGAGTYRLLVTEVRRTSAT